MPNGLCTTMLHVREDGPSEDKLFQPAQMSFNIRRKFCYLVEVDGNPLVRAVTWKPDH